MTLLFPMTILLILNAGPLKPGNHSRSVKVGETKRTFHIHIPPKYDPKKPTPVVIALHGAAMTGEMMRYFTGLDRTADAGNFVVVYPDGVGRTWNAGPLFRLGGNKSDDVAFMREMLDDMGKVINIDQKRIFATGMSNGGMMCYRLAAELSDRIAAIAPVAGTMVIAKAEPKRPISVLHFHGTLDSLVPYESKRGMAMMKGVEPTMSAWVKANGCSDQAKEEEVTSKNKDDLKVMRKVWTGGKDGTEVVLYTIKDGGHTWPGRDMALGLLGKSTKSLKANDVIWEFFQKHPIK